MSEIDNDLHQRLKHLADEVQPDAKRERVVLDRARVKRRLVAMTSGLVVLLLIGGIAGASMLWQPEGNRPAPPRKPNETFARYFFQAAKKDMSARGVVEVNSEEGTLCLEGTFSDNIKASHLLWRTKNPVEDGPRIQEVIAVTFFDPSDDEVGASLPPGSAICLPQEQLGVLDGEFEGEDLQALIDNPDEFRVDFHRGPNDDPGLIAKLIPQGTVDPCAGGPRLTEVPGRPVTTEHRVPLAGECFQEHGGRGKVPVFLTATIGADGRPLSKAELGATNTCDLVAEAHSKLEISADGRLIGWFVPPEAGRCRSGSQEHSIRLLDGSYSLAVGCHACEYAGIRVNQRLSPSFKSIEDAISFLADRLDVDVALPRDLPAGIRLAQGQSVTVDKDGNLESGRLALRFGKKGHLLFDFGKAGFDGCGGEGAVEVDIAGHPGLMLAKDSYPWTQIIWPARPGDNDATYGIYGSLRAEQMLQLARSMQIAVTREADKTKGCL